MLRTFQRHLELFIILNKKVSIKNRWV